MEEIPPEPTRCIAVDSPSHLYLAGKTMIPTHNSEALFMAALMFVDIPGYKAIIFRRSYADLTKASALIDRSMEWLRSTDAKWNGDKYRWTFPSGALIEFGYLDTDATRFNYRSSEYHFLAFDEITTLSEVCYRYLFSRMRRQKGSDIPIRVRSASNPGGPSHEFIRNRFLPPRGVPIDWGKTYVQHQREEVEGEIIEYDRAFVPSRLEDNTYIDRAEYIKSLANLEPVTRRQLLLGDWDAYEGGRFKREWFGTWRRERVGEKNVYVLCDHTGREKKRIPVGAAYNITMVDPAATSQQTTRKGSDPDYTAIGTFAACPANDVLVLDMVRERMALEEIIPRIAEVKAQYHPLYVGIEAVAFQAWFLIEANRHPNIGSVKRLKPHIAGTQPGVRLKLARATPAIVRASEGHIYVPESAPWKDNFIAELVQFTGDDKIDGHSDQLDTLAYCVLDIDSGGFSETDERPEPEESGSPRSDRPIVNNTREWVNVRGSAADRRGLYGRGRDRIKRWERKY